MILENAPKEEVRATEAAENGNDKENVNEIEETAKNITIVVEDTGSNYIFWWKKFVRELFVPTLSKLSSICMYSKYIQDVSPEISVKDRFNNKFINIDV